MPEPEPKIAPEAGEAALLDACTEASVELADSVADTLQQTRIGRPVRQADLAAALATAADVLPPSASIEDVDEEAEPAEAEPTSDEEPAPGEMPVPPPPLAKRAGFAWGKYNDMRQKLLDLDAPDVPGPFPEAIVAVLDDLTEGRDAGLDQDEADELIAELERQATSLFWRWHVATAPLVNGPLIRRAS